ncbi:MAG: hypothetical protein JWQ10_1867 [Herbaspirillum sp.]|jgi:hypothetical protein|nr:hypothetical protein [Herbaspirillum sp.]
MFAVTKQGGQCVAMPDVCNTPAPPGPPIPMPYPNTALPMIANPTPENVLFVGMPPLNMASRIGISNGNQPGSLGGVVSAKIMGQAEPLSGSLTVHVGGHPVLRLGDPTKQNDGNALGAIQGPPSQLKVSIQS